MMKNFLLTKMAILLLCVMHFSFVYSQDSLATEQSYFQKFQELETANEQSVFFFETQNRYNKKSGYDWLDVVQGYLKTASELKDTTAVFHYELMEAQIYHDLGDYDKSLQASNKLYSVLDTLDLTTQSLVLELIDANYSKLELYDKQFEIRRKRRDLGLSTSVTFYDIYANLGQYRKAMTDYIAEEKKGIDEGDFYGKAMYNNNVGNYLRLDGSTPTAMKYFKKADAFLDVYLSDIINDKSEKELNDAYHLRGVILGNKGKCHVQFREYVNAIPFLEESLEIFKEYNSGKFSSDFLENALELADCYLQLNNFKKATDYLSIVVAPKKAENVLKMNSLYAIYYDKTGDYKSANSYLNRNIRIRDSLDKKSSKIKNQQLTAVLSQDLENSRTVVKEQKVALEKSRNDIIEKDKNISLVFISLVFTLLGFAGLVYAYLKSIKTQRLIAEQKHIIENALVEKDSLLKEIHHRVKNNLQMVSSLLSLQTKNTKSKAAIEALEEGKSRVKAMALIHQKLYQNDDLSVIEMQSYIESLINSVQSVYKKGGHNINITVDAEGVELDIDRAIPFGLILNELVSNSFKYAFPNEDSNGKIYIHIRKTPEQEGFFEYTDNGVGLPEDSEERANSSMGIRLMNRLANQLQTSLNTDRTGDGVRFWFNFK